MNLVIPTSEARTGYLVFCCCQHSHTHTHTRTHARTHAHTRRDSSLNCALDQIHSFLLCFYWFITTMHAPPHPCSSDWWWLSLVLFRKIDERFLFSPPSLSLGNRCNDALGFASAGSVSSYSTLQIFRDASTRDGCFSRDEHCTCFKPGRSPRLSHSSWTLMCDCLVRLLRLCCLMSLVVLLMVGSHDRRSLQLFPKMYYYAAPILRSETTLPLKIHSTYVKINHTM